MNTIYAVTVASGSNPGSFDLQWTQQAAGLAPGYTSLTLAPPASRQALFAYNKATQQLDAYVLSASDPWIQKAAGTVNLGEWDRLNSFVLGNVPYLMAYRADTGRLGIFAIADDLSLSPPYIFSASHTTPSDGFSTVGTYTSLSQQYLLGYNVKTGRVENLSISVVPSSRGGVPPLLVQNVWYHFWAPNWRNFAFFQLGGSTFFFKINKTDDGKVMNVNIDHMQDNPAMGSIEIATDLKKFLPDAGSISAAAIVPWEKGDPYLLTYIGGSGTTAIYRIHSDCLGLTLSSTSAAATGASDVIPYRIAGRSYALLYQSAATPPAP